MKYKDKLGNEVTAKEFFNRWKDGIKNITPMQQVNTSLIGGLIVLIGIIWGLCYSILIGSYWLALILFGSFIVSGMGVYGNYQRFLALSKMEAQMKQLEVAQPVEEMTYVQ